MALALKELVVRQDSLRLYLYDSLSLHDLVHWYLVVEENLDHCGRSETGLFSCNLSPGTGDSHRMVSAAR